MDPSFVRFLTLHMPARRPSPLSPPPLVSAVEKPTLPALPRAEDVLDALSDAIVALDSEWRIIFANRAFIALEQQLGGVALAVGENFLEGFMSQFEQTRPERADAAALLPPLELFHAAKQFWLEAWTTEWSSLTLVHLKDISERKRVEFHGEFLARLNDELSRLSTPGDILDEASRAVGLHLNVDRCSFCEVSAEGAEIRVAHDWARSGFRSMAGIHRAVDFGTPEMWAAMSRGPVAVSDVNLDPLSNGQGVGYEHLRVQAHVSVPYLRDGVWTASIAVTTELPRVWRKDELDVLAQALARVWPVFEQARSRDALQESETRQQNLLRSLPVACYTIDAQGRLTFFNAAAARLWGREPQLHTDFWCGAAGLTTLDGQPIAAAESPVAQALRERRPMPVSEAWLFRPDGSRRRIVAQPNPLFNAHGDCLGVVCVVLDVTDEKLAHEDARKAADRLNVALSSANLGDWEWDAATDRMKLSPRCAEIYGVSVAAGLTRTAMRQGLHPDDRPRSLAALQHALATRTDYNIEYRVVWPDGSLHWVAAKGRSLFSGSGEITGMVGVIQDITDRKRQVEDLQELTSKIEAQTRLFDTVLSHITDFAYIFDVQGRFQYANQPLLELWQLPLESVVGKTFSELNYPAPLADRLQRQIEQVVATGKALRDETPFTGPNGKAGYYEYIFNPVIGHGGQIEAVAGSTRVITERKRAEALGDGQRQALQLIIEDAPLGQILDVLLRTVEAGGSRRLFASVMLLVDDHLVVGSAPSLPTTYTDAINGMAIGPGAGSCGRVAWTKDSVFVGDIDRDPLWADWRELALRHNLRACWSIPVLASDGAVLGVLAIYYPEAQVASSEDLSLIDLATRTAAVAIEKKRAASALRQSDDQLRLALDAARLGSWEWDATTGEVKSSTRCKANFGVPPGVEVFTERDYSERIHPDDADRVEATTQAAARTTKVYEMEYRVIWPDGSLHWIVESGRGLADDAGKITKVVGVTHEITERKFAEESLRRSEAQLRMVTDNAPVLLVRADRQHRFTFVNRAYAEHFGIAAESLVGRHVSDVVGPAAYASFRDQMDEALAGRRVEFEIQVPYEKLGRRWTHAIYVPEYDRQGAVTGLLGVISDIAARKEAELELKRARDEALAASQAKDNFLAALSHELRTPLNPVLLVASSAAANTTLTPEVRADFELIRKNVDLEARLIDDLLDLTRITRGKLLLEKNRCDVHEVLADAIANVRGDITEKELDFHADLQAGSTEVTGDPVRLQQVFWNILKNAVKFTPHGGRMSLRTQVDVTSRQIVVEINDTGIGMTAEEIARAFQAFAQGEHATSNTNLHRFGGLGLGLAISKMLVDLHGGLIEARSAGRDQGSAFTVSLPLRPENELTPVAVVSSPRGRGPDLASPPVMSKDEPDDARPPRQVLLVEDHGPTRLTLRHLLELRGFSVIAAKSAAEALAFAAAATFDLVISDVGLPDRNGYDLIAELRARQPALRAIALSGYGMEDDLARSARAGFHAHLVKPVTIGMLEHAIATLPAHFPDDSASPS